jgi:hypothetical protein
MRRPPGHLSIGLVVSAAVLVAALAGAVARFGGPFSAARPPVDERAEVEEYSARLGALDAQYRERFRSFWRDQQATSAQVSAALEAATTLEDRNRAVQALQRLQGLERFQAYEAELRRLRDQLSELPLPSSPSMRQIYLGYLTAYNTAVLSASAMVAFPQLWQDTAVKIASAYAQEAESTWWRARRELSNLEQKYQLPSTEPPEPPRERIRPPGGEPGRST